MHNHPAACSAASDIDLDDHPEPAKNEYGGFLRHRSLYVHLLCTRYEIGSWDEFGVRVLPNEDESYATVHFRIPPKLPAAFAARLAEFSTQRIAYTDRDRKWDALLGGGPTSDRNRWSCFVDSVLAAVDFARAALESAVWAHARGDEWSWVHRVPGRVEYKYDLWGDGHPNTYDPYEEYDEDEDGAQAPHSAAVEDVQF